MYYASELRSATLWDFGRAGGSGIEDRVGSLTSDKNPGVNVPEAG